MNAGRMKTSGPAHRLRLFCLALAVAGVAIPLPASAAGATPGSEPADEGDALVYCPAGNSRHTLVVVVALDKGRASMLARNLADRGYVVAVTGSAPAHIARVVKETRARHVADADPCHVGGGFGMVFYSPRSEVQAYLSGRPEARGPMPLAIAVVRSVWDSGYIDTPYLPGPVPSHAAFLPALVFQANSTVKVAAGKRLSPYLQEVFARGLGHIDALDGAGMREFRSADTAPCADALVASRIDPWFRAHVEHRDKALAEVGRWGTVTFVAARSVPEPAACKALADKKAAGEREWEREGPEILPMFTVPLLLGAAVRPGANGAGFVVGTRPELVVAAFHKGDYQGLGPAIGAGGYLDAVTMSGRVSRQTFLGGGATVAGYTSKFRIALSGGIDAPTNGGSVLPTVGGFLGLHGHDAFGIQVDAHPGNKQTSVVTVTLNILGLPSAEGSLFGN